MTSVYIRKMSPDFPSNHSDVKNGSDISSAQRSRGDSYFFRKRGWLLVNRPLWTGSTIIRGASLRNQGTICGLSQARRVEG